MPRKKKVANLKQVDGRLTEAQYRELDEILGLSRGHGYSTVNAEEYESQLKEMHLADLQSEAIKRGLMPKDNRKHMIDALIREFRKNTVHVPMIQKETWTPAEKKRLEKLLGS